MADLFLKLKKMVAAESEPKLDGTELQLLLTSYAMPDKEGRTPDEAEWTPTYNLNAAAAEGWRWKAARASELVSSNLDGDRMSSQQIFDHCLDMIKMYSRGTATALMGVSE